MSAKTFAKVILSSKGELRIPEKLRSKMGLHLGSSKLLLELNNNILKISPVKDSISKFFGMGKRKNQPTMTIEDIDEAIAETVIKNDKC